MKFTQEELLEIKILCQFNPLMNRVWNELQKIENDPAGKFYKSLVNCTDALSKELDSVHDGTYNKMRILKSDTKTYKRIFSLLTSSDRILKGLERKKHEPVDNEVIHKEDVKEDGSIMSYTDRIADNSRINK